MRCPHSLHTPVIEFLDFNTGIDTSTVPDQAFSRVAHAIEAQPPKHDLC